MITLKRIAVLLVVCAALLSAKSIIPARYEVPCDSALAAASLDTAIAQNGVREATNRNDGKQVEAYLKSVGLDKGNPYCAAGQYWSFEQAAQAMDLPPSAIPILKTGSTGAMYKAALAMGMKDKRKNIEVGDLVFWRIGNTNSGHVERIIAIGKAGWVTTIAFNTTINNSGNQREGGGVAIRKRCLSHPLSNMLLRGVVGFDTRG